jgi:hypothetical protein
LLWIQSNPILVLCRDCENEQKLLFSRRSNWRRCKDIKHHLPTQRQKQSLQKLASLLWYKAISGSSIRRCLCLASFYVASSCVELFPYHHDRQQIIAASYRSIGVVRKQFMTLPSMTTESVRRRLTFMKDREVSLDIQRHKLC